MTHFTNANTTYVLTVFDPDWETEATERHKELTAFKDTADASVFETMQQNGATYEKHGHRTYEIKVTQVLFHDVVRPVPNSGTIVPNSGTPGVKYDAGKPRPTLLVASLAQAVTEVAKVLTYGADKYDDDNWRKVPGGPARYNDALLRHLLAEAAGEANDTESGLLHAAHTAANALIRLELLLRSR